MNENGEPAYPCRLKIHPEAMQSYDYPGMTLRDYFAGQALVGLMADPNNTSSNKKNAEIAYEIAVAMLAEREDQ